jgi:hypothetical protein
MSDINAKILAAGNLELAAGNLELQELSDLAARKDLHEVNTEPANSADLTADLTAASISPKNVMRVPQQAAIRSKAGQIRSAHSVELTNNRSRTNSRPTARTTGAKSSENRAHGIFKNPKYSYDGGVINKIFSLLGNIIEVLVRFLLRLLGARDVIAPGQRPQQAKTTADREGSSTKESQELEREKRKERREQSEQLVKRQ